MTFEAIRLRSWYVTPLGRMVTLLIGNAMERWLAEDQVARTLGFGFIQPYGQRLNEWTDNLLGAAPAEMGVAPWQSTGANRIALVRPDALCFPDGYFDRVVMIHLLEGTASPRATLREAWRVLRPGGVLLVVTPNRQGWWARSDATPFGWGRPFSPFQLQNLLQDTFFIPMRSSFALFIPPLAGRLWMKTALTWEKTGGRWFPPLGGVILCEAEKTVYATTPLTVMERRGFGMGTSWILPATENHHGKSIPRQTSPQESPADASRWTN